MAAHSHRDLFPAPLRRQPDRRYRCDRRAGWHRRVVCIRRPDRLHDGWLAPQNGHHSDNLRFLPRPGASAGPRPSARGREDHAAASGDVQQEHPVHPGFLCGASGGRTAVRPEQVHRRDRGYHRNRRRMRIGLVHRIPHEPLRRDDAGRRAGRSPELFRCLWPLLGTDSRRPRQVNQHHGGDVAHLAVSPGRRRGRSGRGGGHDHGNELAAVVRRTRLVAGSCGGANSALRADAPVLRLPRTARSVRH